MPFLCYLCHLGPNRGFRFLPFWKTAIIFLSMNRYVWFIQGKMAKCGCAAPFCAACMGGSGVACAAAMHGRASFAQRSRAGLRPRAVVMHGRTSFARRSRVGLRPSRGGRGWVCAIRGNCVRGHLRAGYLRTGQLCPGASASDGTPASWVPASGAPACWVSASGAPLSDLTCRRGTCVRAAAGHTGLSPCRPHPELRHPGTCIRTPASGV